MASDTREQILQLGETMLRQHGYNGFSYHDIATPLGIRNAAVHYHFPTKEDLAVAVIRASRERLEHFLATTHDMNELRRLERFLHFYTDSAREGRICVPGSLGSNFPALGNAVREEAAAFVDALLDWLTSVLKSGRTKKTLNFSGEPRTRAIAILSAMTGGLQIARIAGEQEFQTMVRAIIRELKP